ncbi:MAG: peptidase [Thaumarchaeota archaeon]|nr:peptidase [Nitrososphaerota archaeon]
MRKKILIILPLLLLSLLLSSYYISFVSAQYSPGGVQNIGTWYAGEGLKKGNYFHYSMCYFEYKNCSQFEMKFWVSEEIKDGSEEKWKLEVVVLDGNKIIKGDMEIGKIAPEPTGGSDNLSIYRDAYKSTLAWLSAYATAPTGDLLGKGPKSFSQPSWGKIASIGGDQITPTESQTVSVPAGQFDSVLITWKSGTINKIWVVDDFPFPVKADAFVQVSQGIPPQLYKFELLEYKENITSNPFVGIMSTSDQNSMSGCPQDYEFVKDRKNTNTFTMIVEYKYGPKHPIPGCEIEWFVDFKRLVNESEHESEVHFDILVVDPNSEKLVVTRSIAQEEGRQKLFTTLGQDHRFTTVKETDEYAKYAIIVYGTGPEQIVPPPEELGWILIDVQLQNKSNPDQTINTNQIVNSDIPDWVRNNAGWWSEGKIQDQDFISGIQYLIKENIIQIPITKSKDHNATNDVIPDWVRNNAGWWSEGKIQDQDFIFGIQYLIQNRLISISY